MTTILKLENLNYGYEDGGYKRQILKDLSYEFEQGQFYTILGPSGSGKTTLLSIIAGLDKQESGKIYYEGDDLDKIGLYKYRRNKIGIVFQQYNLIANLTVKENIEVGAYLSDAPLDVDELLHVLGLWDHKDKLPNQLSGGQQQRTAIGRAIVKNPDVLLCDEPTGALDYKTSKEILELIEQVNSKYQNTIIIVTHNDAIKHMADQVVSLRDGQIRSQVYNDHKIPAMQLEW